MCCGFPFSEWSNVMKILLLRSAMLSLAQMPLLAAPATVANEPTPNAAPAAHAAAIPFDHIGAVAGKQYSGDGLAVASSPDGVRLRCVFQRLNATVTTEGLWLISTRDGTQGEPFRVVARALGRGSAEALAPAGRVEMAGQVARFIRPGFTEEYSVGVDGLRQDFVIERPPPGDGSLRLELEVDGAKAQAIAGGARLVLADGGRQMVYNRLKAQDARGRELTAKLEVMSANRLAVVLDDTAADYPVRIDPTFSDANWVSLGGLPGIDGTIDTAAADSDGNIYVGGQFSVAGSVIANNVAKWNGSAWSALGSGVSGSEDWIANHVNVSAFAFATNGNLYAAGYFSTAGGVPATNIAQWDGRIWSALGSGIGDSNAWVNVDALACDDSGNLYAGGRFTTAGRVSATNIAQWNGSAWLALGSGIGDTNADVFALTCDSSGNLYEGGDFTSAGDVSATNIAEWNGSSWSALGSGVSGAVFAPGRLGYTGPEVSSLAVVGDNLYVGGIFTLAGGVSVNNVARWDGSSWTALGAGLGTEVRSLVVSGTNLYAGAATWSDITGTFFFFDVAQWNGNSWVELGSGSYALGSILAASGTNLFVGGGSSTISEWNGTTWLALGKGWDDGRIYALAASDTSLYVGGWFTTTAGGGPANYIAQWNGSSWLALGSGISGVGMNPPVAALAVSGTNLFVGGSFTIAGGGVGQQHCPVGREFLVSVGVGDFDRVRV